MRTPLLRTKLFIPPPRPQYVARARLIDTLNHSFERKLTLIAAPAGFGKTTLLSSWIHQMGASKGEDATPGTVHPANVAWLSLDERDNDPGQFWGYVVAALNTIDDRIGQAASTMLDAPQLPPLEALVTVLINTLAEFQPGEASRQRLLLALDDYHLITSEPIHESLNFLLDHLPPILHVVITTRSDPPLHLAQRKARSELTQIRATDLSFRGDEVFLFINSIMGLDLSTAEIAALEERTEGWIAGLQLAALSMKEQKDKHQFVVDFAGNDRYIADYLVDQVLQQQAPDLQAFLLQTSILDRLCAPLCDTVTGQDQSQTFLSLLERANLFLTPLDNQRQWYRYHPLFSDLLRQRLTESMAPAALAQLHQSASSWFEDQDEVIDAVAHALQSGDHERVAGLIDERAQEVFSQFKLNTLAQWIQSLPPGFVQERPKLTIIYAWALLATGQFDVAEQALQMIEARLNASADSMARDRWSSLDPQVRGALIEVTVLRGVLAINRFDIPQVLEFSQRVLPNLTDSSLPPLFNEPINLKTVVVFNLGLAYKLSGVGDAAAEYLGEAVKLSLEQENINILPAAMAHLGQLQTQQGQLHQAEKTYRQALSLATEMSGWPSPLAGMAEIGLGSLAYERNDLPAAHKHFQAGLELAERWNHAESLTAGYSGLAQLLHAQGDGASAFDLLEELIQTLRRSKAAVFIPLVEATRARLWIKQGDLGQATDWFQSSDLTPEGELSFLQEAEALTYARLLIAQHRWEEAESYIARLRQFAEQGERWGRVIELMLLGAVVFEAQGRATQAQEILRHTISRAEPEGYIRLFVDEGPTMAQLLLREATASPGASYLRKLLAAFEVRKPAVTSKRQQGLDPLKKLVEPLSDRELEILACIAEGLSNREIAQQLSISLATVKSHARNIYGKLDVNSRTKAVAQARALGMLPYA